MRPQKHETFCHYILWCISLLDMFSLSASVSLVHLNVGVGNCITCTSIGVKIHFNTHNATPMAEESAENCLVYLASHLT